MNSAECEIEMKLCNSFFIFICIPPIQYVCLSSRLFFCSGISRPMASKHVDILKSALRIQINVPDKIDIECMTFSMN